MITQARLKELFSYDPKTGFFTNLVDRGSRAKAGERAGSLSQRGYRDLKVDGVSYREHHLAWLYVNGIVPEQLDHKNGVRHENWIDNLRPANGTQQNFNAERATGASALRGAYFDSRVQRWYSQIKIGGVVKWLGHFDSAEDAHRAFMAEVNVHHGEFALHNRNSYKEAA